MLAQTVAPALFTVESTWFHNSLLLSKYPTSVKWSWYIFTSVLVHYSPVFELSDRIRDVISNTLRVVNIGSGY